MFFSRYFTCIKLRDILHTLHHCTNLSLPWLIAAQYTIFKRNKQLEAPGVFAAPGGLDPDARRRFQKVCMDGDESLH
jgi:hypothetical protein